MNRVVAHILLAGALCLVPRFGFSSEEQILEPIAVSLRADAGADFGEVSVNIRTKGRTSERRISKIELTVGGKAVHIPEKAYSDLVSPLLNTVELRTEPGYDRNPWLYIFLQTAYRTSDGQWRRKRIHIAFHAGRVESRSIDTPNADGSSTSKTEKL